MEKKTTGNKNSAETTHETDTERTSLSQKSIDATKRGFKATKDHGVKATRSGLENYMRTPQRIIEENQKSWREFWSKVGAGIILWNAIALISMHFIREYIIKHQLTLNVFVTTDGAWEVFFSVFGIVYAIIVGMLIVESLGRFNDLNSVVEQELNSIEDVRDLLLYIPDEKATSDIQEKLAKYIDTVVDSTGKEPMWIPTKREYSDTNEEMKKIILAIGKINTNGSASRIALELIINKFTEVTSYRTERIRRSVEYVNYPLRSLIIGLSLVIDIGIILLYVEPYWVNLLMLICTTTAMATLYVLIKDLNNPFSRGEIWEIDPCCYVNLKNTLVTQNQMQNDGTIQNIPRITPGTFTIGLIFAGGFLFWSIQILKSDSPLWAIGTFLGTIAGLGWIWHSFNKKQEATEPDHSSSSNN